jgi:DNA-binding XRE family transcriptional regulator
LEARMVAQREPYEFPAIRAFATELAAWRGTMSKVELAETLGYTPQLIGQLEAGKNIPSKKFAEDTDTLFKTNGLFVRLWKLVTDTRHLSLLPPGFPRFCYLSSIRMWPMNSSPPGWSARRYSTAKGRHVCGSPSTSEGCAG